MVSLQSSSVKDCTAFLCPKCKHVNLLDLFSEERSRTASRQSTAFAALQAALENGQYNNFLEHQSLDDLDPTCGLCCLLRAAWPGPESKPPYRVTMHSVSDVTGGYDDPVGTRWLQISGEFPRVKITGLPWRCIKTFNSITEASFSDTGINFRQLKYWIEYCYRNHYPEYKADPDWYSVEGMNLIDVHNRSVDKAPSHQV